MQESAEGVRKLLSNTSDAIEGAEKGEGRPLVGSTLLEMPITLAGTQHTLKQIEGPDGPIWKICSSCTKVSDLLDRISENLPEELDDNLKQRLEELRKHVKNMKEGMPRNQEKSTNTMRNLLGVLSEVALLQPSLIPAGRKVLKVRTPTVSFANQTSDPAVAERANELFSEIYQQLYHSRQPLFRGKQTKQTFKAELLAKAKARSVLQAQRELHGSPLALPLGAPARLHIEPDVDIPMGFYDREGFESFSDTLYKQLPSSDAQLVLEGSAVTGRRFDRAVDFEHTGTPFDVGRLSDYDVAIVSKELYDLAVQENVPLAKDGIAKTMVLRPQDLKKLGLEKLQLAAQRAIQEATGISHPINFKIYRGDGLDAARPHLPLLGGN